LYNIIYERPLSRQQTSGWGWEFNIFSGLHVNSKIQFNRKKKFRSVLILRMIGREWNWFLWMIGVQNLNWYQTGESDWTNHIMKHATAWNWHFRDHFPMVWRNFTDCSSIDWCELVLWNLTGVIHKWHHHVSIEI